jgi:MFS family permease
MNSAVSRWCWRWGCTISANSLGGVTGRMLGGFVGEHFGWAAAFGAVGILSAVLVGGRGGGVAGLCVNLGEQFVVVSLAICPDGG